MKVAIVVPNWNGEDFLETCLDSLTSQSQDHELIVVENGSTDRSINILKNYPKVTALFQSKNLGFAGGVNAGINYAIENDFEYVALFNNDAIADMHWLRNLVGAISQDDSLGIATGALLHADGETFDSTGDFYSIWGLAFPRSRDREFSRTLELDNEVFGASGGASLYRVRMLREIGLFDEDFFAYYEDVDLSFRAQLFGWKIRYVKEAVAYHEVSGTSSKIKGFTTYQTMKNYPLLLYKNVPTSLMSQMLPRFLLAYTLMFPAAAKRGQLIKAVKGAARGSWLLLKKRPERKVIQKARKVSDDYINCILVHDLPPDAIRLRKLRSRWRKLTGEQ